jgi:hypothetical protein
MNELPLAEMGVPKQKIYSAQAIIVSTLVTGPLTGGYMLAKNFRTFGENSRAMWAMVLVAAYLAFVIVSDVVPFLNMVPGFAFAIPPVVIMLYTLRNYQETNIAAHFAAGGEKVSTGKIVVLGVINLVLTMVFVLGGSILLSYAMDDTVHKIYGDAGHDIAYRSGNISEQEIDRIADALTKTTYFDSEKKFVDVEDEGGKYELTLYCNASVKDDEKMQKRYGLLRDDLQKLLPDEKIVMNLVTDTHENVFQEFQ